MQPKSGHKENPFDSKVGPGDSQLNHTYSYETPFFVVPEMCKVHTFSYGFWPFRGVFLYWDDGIKLLSDIIFRSGMIIQVDPNGW